ncbi:uncharacterized mitochondrial protein AtMg00810-like [Nymphaea colorata]|uniref:uncharacterized mitochondrial protein AtMg00810-like n=1 Tax=Nymphaea colorata TaxID=210225 RepID=UPI00129D3663|nr:uncharacterized mitochondrial protein AtMg00810-like [Nymphaea colorata]
MDDDDLITCIMTGLPSGEYESLKTALNIRIDPVNMKDLLAMLLIHEVQLDEADNLPMGTTSYMQDLLKQSAMVDVKPLPSPLAVGEKLYKFDDTPLLDPTPYRQIVGALYKVCQFMQALTTVHWAAVKRILRYIKHTLHLGFLIRPSSCLSLTTYSDADWDGNLDADWDGNPDDRRSTTSLAIFFGDSLVSWSAKKQNTVA